MQGHQNGSLGRSDDSMTALATPSHSRNSMRPSDAAGGSPQQQTGAILFSMMQDQRNHFEKHLKRMNRTLSNMSESHAASQAKTETGLCNLGKKLEDQQGLHTDQMRKAATATKEGVEEVKRIVKNLDHHAEELRVDFRELQHKVKEIHTRETQLTGRVTLLDEQAEKMNSDMYERLKGIDIKLEQQRDAIIVTKNSLEESLKAAVQEKLQLLEDKLAVQIAKTASMNERKEWERQQEQARLGDELLGLKEELRMLKDRLRAQQDHMQPPSLEPLETTPQTSAITPLRPEAEVEDTQTIATQPLKCVTPGVAYSLRSRCIQPSATQPANALTMDELLSAQKWSRGAATNAQGSQATVKIIRPSKRAIRETEPADTSKRGPGVKRRKQPEHHTSLAKICCEAQWEYANDLRDENECEFITRFLNQVSEGCLCSAEKKRFKKTLKKRGLVAREERGMPVLNESTDWSEVWETLWTIREVREMYLNDQTRAQ